MQTNTCNSSSVTIKVTQYISALKKPSKLRSHYMIVVHWQPIQQFMVFLVIFSFIVVMKNCTCNNCATSCKDDDGFMYTESSVF